MLATETPTKKIQGAKKVAPSSPRAIPPTLTGTSERLAFQLATGANTADAAEREAAAAASAVVGTPPGNASTAAAQPTSTTAAPFGIIVDDDSPLGPGQIHRIEFLDSIGPEIERAADEELKPSGRTARDCPYLAYWLQFYRGRPAAQIERAIQSYARPERTDLAGLKEAMLARVHGAVQAWTRSGRREVQEPEGAALFGDGDNATGGPGNKGGIQRKTTGGGQSSMPPASDPAAVRAQLRNGQPLQGNVLARMEHGFGRSFARVRLHTDAHASYLASAFSARAFTVGSDIAFASGQYQPGTIRGDALIAHELAHVLQQEGRTTSARPDAMRYAALESDADRSAVGAVKALWRDVDGETGGLARNVMPHLRSGLRLQRCDWFKSDATPVPSSTSATPPTLTPDAGPTAPDPDTVIVAYVKERLGDNKLQPPEWADIGKRAKELKIDESRLRSRLSFDLDFDSQSAETLAYLALNENAAARRLATTYATDVTGPPRKFTADPLAALLTQILDDAALDKDELDALRRFYGTFDHAAVRAGLSGRGISEPTLSSLLSILELGFGNYRTLVSQPGFLPIKLQKTAGNQLSASIDLRKLIVQSLTATGAWDHSVFPAVRAVLGVMSKPEAISFLNSVEIEPTSADLIAQEFTRDEALYKDKVADRTNLTFFFRKSGAQWELTPETRQNLLLPWHPVPINPLGPAGGKPERGSYTLTNNIGPHKFASGLTKEAERLNLTFRGKTMFVLSSNDLLAADTTLFDRLDIALSVIPVKHIGLIKELVLDPGNDPGGKAIADAARTGVVNIYFSGGGPSVPQVSLNQTAAHEFGHLVSYRAERTDPDFWAKWRKAIADDVVAVSRYGLTNQDEDFAEAYVLYLSGGGMNPAARARYSHRFAILDLLF